MAKYDGNQTLEKNTNQGRMFFQLGWVWVGSNNLNRVILVNSKIKVLFIFNFAFIIHLNCQYQTWFLILLVAYVVYGPKAPDPNLSRYWRCSNPYIQFNIIINVKLNVSHSLYNIQYKRIRIRRLSLLNTHHLDLYLMGFGFNLCFCADSVPELVCVHCWCLRIIGNKVWTILIYIP